MELYTEAYVSHYLDWYHLDPFWQPKLAENQRIVAALCNRVPNRGTWVDLCCGAGQHFQAARPDIHCIGIDRSEAQLAVARRHSDAPNRSFVRAQLRDLAEVRPPRVDLWTCFWAAICYLPDPKSWLGVFKVVADAIPAHGAFYLELPAPQQLQQFNTTEFAGRFGFCVTEVLPHDEPGWWSWVYEDSGGTHRLLTPEFDTLRNVVEAVGMQASCESVVQALVQVVCTPAPCS